MFSIEANYEVIELNPLVIKDLGPWDTYRSVTNAVEFVISDLIEKGLLKHDRKLFYYDSENEFSEIVVKDMKFVRFEFVEKNPAENPKP